MPLVKCTAILCIYNKQEMCTSPAIELENVEYRQERAPKGYDYNDNDGQMCKTIKRVDMK